MARSPVVTPCPTSLSTSNLPIPIGGRRQSSALSAFGDDTLTIDIDYTRAIQHQIKNVPPRRKSTFHRRAETQPAVTIFEDVPEDQELVVEHKPELRGETLLGKRAQKIPGGKPSSQSSQQSSSSDARPAIITKDTHPLKPIGQARRRSSLMPQAEETRAIDFAGEVPKQEEVSQSILKKNPRRRTIFVPSDDTTIMTIHPGAQTTARLDDTFQLPGAVSFKADNFNNASNMNEQKDVAKPARRPRMSLAVAPKRVPLQQRPGVEGNVPGFDVTGQNGGKENLPPNASKTAQAGKSKVMFDTKPSFAEERPVSRKSLFAPTAASQARQSIVSREAVPLPRKSLAASRDRMLPRASIINRGSISPEVQNGKPALQNGQRTSPKQTTATVTSTQPIRPYKRSPTQKLQQYPVLTEDLPQPDLYEDNWLSQQEVSLTEIVNHIFVDSTRSLKDHLCRQQRSLRDRMIAIYHQPRVTTLHKRLQASLLCGALSRPKDLPMCTDPAADIGLRKNFLSLWLNSYDEEVLKTAAEVVFGRQLSSKAADSPSASGIGATESHLDPLKHRRALTGFLETFLVDCCDVEYLDDPGSTSIGSGGGNYFEAQRWRKIVLRSLMLIWLLDQIKTSNEFERCLFKRSSPRKTSEAMLLALSSMLAPSVGDITRTLRRLNYEVDYVQDPLEEVEYCVQNLAVDLRDGIFLTRLVEILLFTGIQQSPHQSIDENATVTVQMPDEVILESLLWTQSGLKSPRILSQHLKMPCLGRAQKLYNVHLALSALRDHGKLGAHVGLDIMADDIVDGHREKTLSLLWSLVGTYGMSELVDWKELIEDIKRTNLLIGAPPDDLPDPSRDDLHGLSQSRRESLLKAWASSCCSTKGLRISNLTTSFADGKAYAAIIETFTKYLSCDALALASSASTILDRQLRSLGCSVAFTKQLVCSMHTIPSRKTTVSNLAFLASRLLPLARQSNAAAVIQRFYRLRLRKVEISRRISLARLAHACATVVQTQQRLVSAATVLQRAWRQVVDARIQRLHMDAVEFQTIARGWLIRRRLVSASNGNIYDVGLYWPSLKSMGGW